MLIVHLFLWKAGSERNANVGFPFGFVDGLNPKGMNMLSFHLFLWNFAFEIKNMFIFNVFLSKIGFGWNEHM